jgi:hypothetical protein
MNKYLKLKGIVLLLAIIVCSCNTIERDWDIALTINTVDSYEEFIKKYPESDFTNEAKTKVEYLEWEKAVQQNVIAVYEKFMTKYPESAYINEAKEKIESLEWEKATNENNITSYRVFVNKYPESQFVTEAYKKIEYIDYEHIIKFDNKDSLLSFVSNYPTSSKLTEVINKVRSKVNKGNVTYSYKTFWLYKVQDDKTGAWVYPTERVFFGNGMSDKTITANTNGQSSIHELLYQDIATYKGEIKIPVFAYQGCPFTISSYLSVEKEIKFDFPLTIEVESSSDNILWVSKESALPFLYNNGNLLSGYNTALNVTWLFLNKGNLFFAGNDGYLIQKDSARIEFRSDGVKLDGVIKFKK